MNQQKSTTDQPRRFPLRGLSLQQRLPLLLFVLLLCMIIVCSYVSYIGVRTTAISAGQERLRSVTKQLSDMFGQSAQTMITASQNSSNSASVIQTVRSAGTLQSDEMKTVLEKLSQDRVSVYVVLLDSAGQELFYHAKDSTRPLARFRELHTDVIRTSAISKIGKFYLVQDSIYFPVIVPVMEDKKRIGYLVRWRLQYSTPQAIAQLSQLLGTDASLYAGNTDGSLWTDLGKPVKAPGIDTPYSRFFKYNSIHDTRVFATAQAIPQTSWVVLVEFSQQKILEPSRSVLRWIIITGAILIVIGLLLTWLMSRNITRPLKKLTAATSAIANGDYSMPIATNRKDEIGELARSFNSMQEQVHHSQQLLENKVQERTTQLETANHELEAFSYSVSHDLRAPLRAVNGYAMMLKEDYADKLDEEANRLADKIILNSKRMGQLIDDLIAFSQMGSKEVSRRDIDMQELATSCVSELLHHEPANKYTVNIQQLPHCLGDPNLIKQVWMNIIGNAIKYSSGVEAPKIEIGYSIDADMHTYYVRDNGAGFDMKYADKLFGVFQRLHSAKHFEGTGIGLAFAKRIISKHKGTIRAEAEPGKGATFYFSLPKNTMHE